MDGHLPRLGRMFGDAYELWQRATYDGLARDGFAGIRPAHSPIFRHLGPEGARISDLAAKAGIAKQSMAYLVNALCDAGYLSIEDDPQDGRARLVKLTARGMLAEAHLAKRSRAFEARMLDALGAARLAELKSLVADLLDATRGQ